MEGKKDHPDRNEQFEYINSLSKKFVRNGHPVISVDTKKKELIGNYKNSGREWRKKGTPIDVLSHDFPDPALPKAVPYGVYDIDKNIGWINVGIDGDTAEFAVESIRQWWKRMGKKIYKTSKKLLIFADSGGSNSYRSHLWKHELQKFCDKEKVQISVSHFPPGTSKWNKIEHRLFSFVSMNWRGQPLLDYMTIVNLIANTKTTSGLKVAARLDTNNYERGIKLTKQEIESVNIKDMSFMETGTIPSSLAKKFSKYRKLQVENHNQKFHKCGNQFASKRLTYFVTSPYRVHYSHDGKTPNEIAGERQLASIDLNKFKWQPVCGGMYYSPIAA
jgi:hypothetical protein